MKDKFRKQFAAFIFTVIAAAVFTSCSNKDSKIVGTWKRLDVEDNVTVTFTAAGDFNFKFETKPGAKMSAGTSSGKYEVKGDTLRLYDAPPKNGKDTNVKIIKLEDNSLILESEVKGEKVEEKYEKIGGGVLTSQANSKPNVKEVPLVEPWASMNLPCKNGGVAIAADSSRFTCAYGGAKDRESQMKVITQYLEALKYDGWKVTQDMSGSITFIYQLEKDDKELLLFSTESVIPTENGVLKWDGFGIRTTIRTKN